MAKIDLDQLLNDFNTGKKETIFYYLIGMWIITNSYNKNGYIIDMMVCKGKNHEEAIEEAKEFKEKVMQIESAEYIPLTIGETVLEATKNASYFKDLLWVEEVMPDSEKIKNAVDFVVKKEGANKDEKKYC